LSMPLHAELELACSTVVLFFALKEELMAELTTGCQT
jgi:hypothetical protein